MIEFDCACGTTLRVRDEHAGKKARCPGCGQVVSVPSGDAFSAKPARPRDDDEPARRPRDQESWHEDRPRRRRARAEEEPAPPLSHMALWAMILGIAACVVAVVLLIPPIRLALGFISYIILAAVALAALVVGALAWVGVRRRAGRVGGGGFAIAGLITAAVSLVTIVPLILLGGVYQEGERRQELDAWKQTSQQNLKQLAIALHNYHDVHRACPPAVFRDEQGRPLYSWRVALLPYIEQDVLYRAFRLNEPWDSPHNKQFIAQMPPIYLSPRKDRQSSPGMTHYQVFTGSSLKRPDAPFSQNPKDPVGSKRGPMLVRIVDGTSNTFMIAEAAEPVIWTKPDDLVYEPDEPLPKLGGFFDNGFNAAFFDGSVRFVSTRRASERTLRLLIQHQDGLPIPFEEIEDPEDRPARGRPPWD